MRVNSSSPDTPPGQEPESARPVKAATPPAGRPCESRKPRNSKLLIRYISHSFFVNFLVAFLVLEAVLGILTAVKVTNKFPGFGLDILVIFPVLLSAFGQAMTYTLPVALLAAAGLLVGKLHADREVLALRSFGISPLQTATPFLLVGGLVFLLAYQINFEWGPRMRFQTRNAANLILNRLGYLGAGSNLEYGDHDMIFWVSRYDGARLEGIFLGVSRAEKGLPVSADVLEQAGGTSYPLYLIARTGIVRKGTGEYADYPVVLQLSGVSIFFDEEVRQLTGAKFSQEESEEAAPDEDGKGDEKTVARTQGGRSNFMHRIRMDTLSWPLRIPVISRRVKDLPGRELVEAPAKIQGQILQAKQDGREDHVRHYTSEYHKSIQQYHHRLAMSLAVLTFPLSALLLGLYLNSMNRLLPFFLASSLTPTLFFLFKAYGDHLAEQGHLPALTAHLGNIALIIPSLFLLWRVSQAPRR
jgi:lipopolysaccharide export LptBFGC system permease protein LptF